MTASTKSTFKLSALLKSDAVLAFVLFIMLDAFAGYFFASTANLNVSSNISFSVPYRSRIWWAVRDYVARNPTPEVLLLGASDMSCAYYRAEATYLQKPTKELLNHESRYLQADLASLNSPYTSNFCMAIPGQVASDAYFIVKTLTSDDRKPKVIYYGVIPRDFLDATFTDPSNTDTYKLMSTLGGTKSFELTARNSLMDKAEYLAGQSTASSRFKKHLVTWQHELVHGLLGTTRNDNFESIKTPVALRKIALLELPEDYSPEEITELPFDPTQIEYKSNVAEYQSRYREFKEKTFREQISFLEKLCALCKNEGIELVVGNSPLTDENRALLPKVYYDRYLKEVSQTVQSAGFTFVDFDKSTAFEQNDFYDGVHVNGKGGIKYLHEIAAALSNTSRLASVRKSPL